jgi:hypothetical protein
MLNYKGNYNMGIVGFQEVSCGCERYKKPFPMVGET